MPTSRPGAPGNLALPVNRSISGKLEPSRPTLPFRRATLSVRTVVTEEPEPEPEPRALALVSQTHAHPFAGALSGRMVPHGCVFGGEQHPCVTRTPSPPGSGGPGEAATPGRRPHQETPPPPGAGGRLSRTPTVISYLPCQVAASPPGVRGGGPRSSFLVVAVLNELSEPQHITTYFSLIH